MSRSLKSPYYTDQQNGSTKLPKRRATKAVRKLNLDETPKSGKAYRKESCSWSIRDYSFYSKDPKARRK